MLSICHSGQCFPEIPVASAWAVQPSCVLEEVGSQRVARELSPGCIPGSRCSGAGAFGIPKTSLSRHRCLPLADPHVTSGACSPPLAAVPGSVRDPGKVTGAAPVFPVHSLPPHSVGLEQGKGWWHYWDLPPHQPNLRSSAPASSEADTLKTLKETNIIQTTALPVGPGWWGG